MSNPARKKRLAGLMVLGFLISRVACGASPDGGTSQIEFGADYYAEDWPPERTEIDARLMQRAGFRTVRLVETNWERLEPEEGAYNFAWLDRVIEILNKHGIRAILGTSSYAPPAWLMEKHPDFYGVGKDGVRSRWGGLGFVCPNNPLYRRYVEKLVSALSAHYGHHPGVIGWQIDNELGQNGYACYDTDYCLPKFRRYLQQKFGTLEELNRRWLTVSYGHRYSSWDQIPLDWSLARTTDYIAYQGHQVPLELAADRFFSSNNIEWVDFQAKILRSSSSHQFITHNAGAPSHRVDGFGLARALDFVSTDLYPGVGDPLMPAFSADLARGFNRGNPFLALEFRTGRVGGFTLGDGAPPSGLIRLWAWQILAHGADGLLFFHWRSSLGGTEQYYEGLLDYDGSPGRAFPEISRLGEEIKRVGSKISGARISSSVAEIMSMDSFWALHAGDATFPYYEELRTFDHAFRRLGQNVDFVEPESDLSAYKIVVAPTLHVVDDKIAANLERFVNQGGTLILTARSGFKTQDNLVVDQPLPGLLAPLVQARVADYARLKEASPPTSLGFPANYNDYHPAADIRIASASSEWTGSYKARIWADILEPAGAKTLFRYQGDFYAGRAAVTLAEYGKGKVIYVGPLLDPSFYVDLARRAGNWAKLDVGPEIPEGMDFALRQCDGKAMMFLMNFSPALQSVRLPGRWRDVLSGKVSTGQIAVPSLDLAIVVPEASR